MFVCYDKPPNSIFSFGNIASSLPPKTGLIRFALRHSPFAIGRQAALTTGNNNKNDKDSSNTPIVCHDNSVQTKNTTTK